MRLHHRADDGIRTRDPNLGKVVRYQLRYIRVPRARSSPVAKDDDSASKRGRTNLDDEGGRCLLGALKCSRYPCPESEKAAVSGVSAFDAGRCAVAPQ
jgi:hypothetical protein